MDDKWLENFVKKQIKAEVFWSFEKKRGLGKNHLGGKEN